MQAPEENEWSRTPNLDQEISNHCWFKPQSEKRYVFLLADPYVAYPGHSSLSLKKVKNLEGQLEKVSMR